MRIIQIEKIIDWSVWILFKIVILLYNPTNDFVVQMCIDDLYFLKITYQTI